jgi:nucleotide-binding universal stress UspA family protein
MNKNLLLCVTGDYTSMWAVRFVAEFFKHPETLRCSLLHIAAMDAPHPGNGGTIQEQTKETLRKTAGFLAKRGVPKENITPVLKFPECGAAADIVNEGVSGGFDAVVLGRRGLTRFEELFEKSTVSKLMEERLRIPVWTCRKPALSTRNILLCADGSEQSLRAAEHVGRIVADEPGHLVSILHVHDPGKEEPFDPDSIIDQTRAVLQGCDVPAERIREIVTRGANPARVILDRAKAYKYAAVAMGRTGADKAPLLDIFMGSASTKVVRSLTGAASWLVP